MTGPDPCVPASPSTGHTSRPNETLAGQKLYGDIWANPDPAFEERLRTSLDPRGPENLVEVFGSFGIAPGHQVLDAGARDAHYAIQIARRIGCHVVATDPVPVHLELARRALAGIEPEVAARIELNDAPIESMPFDDGQFDAIWCRDMPNHTGLRRGMAELERVLKPGGRLLVFQTFANPSLDPNEARRLYETMSIVAENMDIDNFHAAIGSTGLGIETATGIGSEWTEALLERGDFNGTQQLLRISRMHRDEDVLLAAFGQARFETTLTDAIWSVNLALGTLTSWIFVIRRHAQ